MIAATLLSAAVIGVNVGSVHSRDGLNNINPGLYAVTQSGYAAGVYHNSHRRTSAWVARKWETSSIDVAGSKVSAAVLAGAIAGYGKPSPLVSPSIAAQVGAVTYRLSYAPRHPNKPNASDAVHFSLEFAQ